MRKFKIGQRVVCLDLNSRPSENKNYAIEEKLEIGKTYTVFSIYDDSGSHIMFEKNGYWQVVDRFRPEMENPIEELMYKIGY
jgi:hypothetical protein